MFKSYSGTENRMKYVEDMTQTVTYAKFMILAQDKDWETAEQCMKVL
jgi:hypothetical protein